MPSNLVFVLVDQLRLQSCGYAGDALAHTPTIDLLAKKGMSFSNAVSSFPVCGPYRASLMTGKYPSTTGMVINEMRANPDHECLGHCLTRSGYETAYIGKWHLWSNQTDNQDSFENGFVPAGPARLGFDGYWAAYNFNFDYFHANYFTGNGSRLVADSYETEFTVSSGLDWLSQRQSKKPFALFLSLGPPHDPWEWENVPRSAATRFEAAQFSLPANYRDGSARYWEPQMDEEWWLREVKPNLPKWQAVYAAMVSCVDESFRKLLEGLQNLGLLEDTLLVFTSDHGEMFGAHGRIAKNIFYEESVRVPFIAHWPSRIPSGHSSTDCLGTADIMPTLLGALGLQIPSSVEGLDLSGQMFGSSSPVAEDTLLQGMGHTWLWMDGFEWRGIRSKRFTYAMQRSDGREFLFDNICDPLQLKNLADVGDFADTKSRLSQRMRAKMAELNDQFRECSWYGRNWTRDRIVLRGARG